MSRAEIHSSCRAAAQQEQVFPHFEPHVRDVSENSVTTPTFEWHADLQLTLRLSRNYLTMMMMTMMVLSCRLDCSGPVGEIFWKESSGRLTDGVCCHVADLFS